MALSGRTPVPLIAAVILLATLLAYKLYAPKAEAVDMTLYPDDLQFVSEGKAVYEAHCASCHGVTLEGENNWRQRNAEGLLPAPPHDETGHTWHHADAALFKLTKYGPQFAAGSDYKSNMPAFEGILTNREILAALSYIKSTWPPKVRATHDEINKRTRAQ